MPDKIFGAARIEGYLQIQALELYDAVDLQVLERVVAGHLWLPYALIEIGLRNAADRVITKNHPRHDGWLTTSDFVSGTIAVVDVVSAQELRHPRDGVTPESDQDLDDPVGDAARMAGRQPVRREHISRDDLIAHLMMGFWVTRCPSIFQRDCGTDFWALMSAEWPVLGKSPDQLATMMRELLTTRNRIAHHEPLIIRRTNIYTKKNTVKRRADLIVSLESAIEKFTRKVALASSIASVIAPPAAPHLARVADNISSALQPLRDALAAAKVTKATQPSSAPAAVPTAPASGASGPTPAAMAPTSSS